MKHRKIVKGEKEQTRIEFLKLIKNSEKTLTTAALTEAEKKGNCSSRPLNSQLTADQPLWALKAYEQQLIKKQRQLLAAASAIDSQLRQLATEITAASLAAPTKTVCPSHLPATAFFRSQAKKASAPATAWDKAKAEAAATKPATTITVEDFAAEIF